MSVVVLEVESRRLGLKFPFLCTTMKIMTTKWQKKESNVARLMHAV